MPNYNEPTVFSQARLRAMAASISALADQIRRTADAMQASHADSLEILGGATAEKGLRHLRNFARRTEESLDSYLAAGPPKTPARSTASGSGRSVASAAPPKQPPQFPGVRRASDFPEPPDESGNIAHGKQAMKEETAKRKAAAAKRKAAEEKATEEKDAGQKGTRRKKSG